MKRTTQNTIKKYSPLGGWGAFFLLLSLPLSAQVSNISIDSKGHLCATDGGTIWLANDATSSWVSTPPPVGCQCTWIDYIAPKTIAACMNKDGEGRVYLSTNNGKAWKIKKIASQPCTAAFHSGESGLWFSFSNMDLLNSMDEGRTWKTFHAPALESAHITDICMMSPKEGLFGVSANKILHTTDGGKTFQTIPTPLDKAQRGDRNFGDGSVTQVMRIGRFYVVRQGDYFVTSYDNINWQRIPDVTYATITNAGTLMTVTTSNEVQEYDDKLNRSWKKSLTDDRKPHYINSICVDLNYAYVSYDDRIWRTDGDSASFITHNIPCTISEPKKIENEVTSDIASSHPNKKRSEECEKAVNLFLNEDYTAAFPLLEAQSTKSDDNEILENLAYCYEEGKGTQQDYGKAAQMLARAANNGSDYALLNLGHYYMNGWGVAKDTVRALALWDRAADHGYEFANQDLANHYVYEGDFEKAAKYIGKSVALGNKDAMYKYATFMMEGMGMKKDSIQGMAYLHKAADLGVAEAMTYIGDSYLSGRILPKNLLLGVAYIEKAIESGDVYAKKFLARCYIKGEGTDRDNKTGFRLLKEAADAGDAEAYNGVASCFIEGVGTLPDPDMAIHYLKLAEASGDATATAKIKEVQNIVARTKKD